MEFRLHQGGGPDKSGSELEPQRVTLGVRMNGKKANPHKD